MTGLVRRVLLAFMLTLLFLSLGAQAREARDKDPLSVTLVHQRVVIGKDGSERYVPANRARPGDLIAYRATYTNRAKRPLSRVLATLPIPAGMVYVPASAEPKEVLASLDGVHFEPVPLKRMVKNEDGIKVPREVPVREYKALRWKLDILSAGKAETVKARMHIVPVAISAMANPIKH